ncbi:hypothetical protein [Algoriphagus pacificus]|uniref:Uncharacterized protein n=1 Tax=Algoriphagus pacificus TaxID=2811234 RepID=A0ABS3CDT7_9BACT|nr:hypothetical protein [Algoriphagus pacificus]MBN7815269.1 hypothetical protein [Algoriphagus pacificus]
MLLVFTSQELEKLVKKFSSKSPEIQFLGENRIKLKMSGVKITLFLNEVSPRQVSFVYKMGAIVNFLAEKFIKLDKPGIFWNKESSLILIDLDHMDLKGPLQDFYIRQLIFDEKKMILEFDMKEESET